MPDDFYGRTQHKTVQARLSADILKHKLKSRFARTDPGRFILRRDLEAQELQEHFAPPRLNQLRSFQALCVPKSALQNFVNDCGAPSKVDWPEIGAKYKFLSDVDLDEWCIVRLVTVLKQDGRVASRRTFSNYGHDPYGKIGFTIVGYIKPDDVSLFDDDAIGLRGAVARELYDHAYLQGRELSAVVDKIDFGSAFVLSPREEILRDRYIGIVVTAELDGIDHKPWSLDIETSPDRLNDLSKLEPWSRELVDTAFFA